jgi:hypothetical protein
LLYLVEANNLICIITAIHHNPQPQRKTVNITMKKLLVALLFTCQQPTAEALSSSLLPSQAKMSDSNDLKPILSHALPGIISYEHVGNGVKQANAEGSRILSRHSSSLSEKYDDECDKDAILETELFLKRVAAKAYTHKVSVERL